MHACSHRFIHICVLYHLDYNKYYFIAPSPLTFWRWFPLTNTCLQHLHVFCLIKYLTEIQHEHRKAYKSQACSLINFHKAWCLALDCLHAEPEYPRTPKRRSGPRQTTACPFGHLFPYPQRPDSYKLHINGITSCSVIQFGLPELPGVGPIRAVDCRCGEFIIMSHYI